MLHKHTQNALPTTKQHQTKILYTADCSYLLDELTELNL